MSDTQLLRLELCDPCAPRTSIYGDGVVGTKGQMGSTTTESILSGGRTPGLHTSALFELASPAGVAVCLTTVDWAGSAQGLQGSGEHPLEH